MKTKDHITKVKILAAAKTLFIEHGFAGTSIGKIAKLAQVNHSLVFHHFTNKENLWVEVKQQIVNTAQKDKQFTPDSNLPFAEFLRSMIINSITFYQNHPDLIRLLNWQRLVSSEHPNIGLTATNSMEQWINAIKQYQNKGDIDKQYKPELVVSFLLSVISSAALDPNIFVHKVDDKKAYVDFCIQCFEKAFK